MSDVIHYESSGKPHPYHLVRPSPWPMLAALSAGLLALGTVFMMHDKIWWIFALGVISLIGVSTMWFRDIIKEAFVEKAHTSEVKFGFRYGMLLFIASEVMFFAAFFWAYFDASLNPTQAIGGVWPPKDITPIHPFDLPFMMTMILLLSGCTCTWAHAALLENNRKDALRALSLTVLLGIIFSFFQGYEYHHASFGFKDTIYASTFYMATGFHGVHVIIGTIFLIVSLWRTYKNQFTATDHFGFEAAAWYWHFVDVVWLFLFIAIYWYGYR
ncbi:MAG TPA: cytochrome c oxidase subunit 3 [Alphaproteobacteria bacterium]